MSYICICCYLNNVEINFLQVNSSHSFNAFQRSTKVHLDRFNIFCRICNVHLKQYILSMILAEAVKNVPQTCFCLRYCTNTYLYSQHIPAFSPVQWMRWYKNYTVSMIINCIYYILFISYVKSESFDA